MNKDVECQRELLSDKESNQQRAEEKSDYQKAPYFIISLLIILICVHLSLPDNAHVWLEWPPGAWWREPWRLVTYSFVHVSASHFCLNALVALIVGWALEIEERWWRVLIVWVGGVVAGALGAGLLQPTVRVAGASAAVYALLTAHIPNVFLRYNRIKLCWFRILSVVVLSGSELIWTLIEHSCASNASVLAQSQQHPVAWSAHLLGAIVGVLLGFIIFKVTEDNPYQFFNKICRIVSAVLLVLTILAIITYYVVMENLYN